MKAVTVVALLASMAVTTVAQAQTYKWEDDYCSMKGDFDSKKYTAKQIKNSHFVLEGLNRLNIEGFVSVGDIDTLDRLSMKNIDTLTEEYKQVKDNVERLNVVPEAKGYKQELLKTIDGEYERNRLTLLAYLNPSEALKQSPKMCKTYIEPFLQSEKAVQTRWKQLVEEQIQEQGEYGAEQLASYRKIATKRYQQEKASNPAKYAKMDLVRLGYGNCVNNQAYRADSDRVYSDTQKLNKTLFGKSFKQMCDEP